MTASNSNSNVTNLWSQTNMDAAGHYAPVNGVNLYYEVHGSGGTPLILIHGGLGMVGMFATIMPTLAETRQVIRQMKDLRPSARGVRFQQLLDATWKARIQQNHVWLDADGDPQAAVGAVGDVDHVPLSPQLNRDAVGQCRGGAANDG